MGQRKALILDRWKGEKRTDGGRKKTEDRQKAASDHTSDQATSRGGAPIGAGGHDPPLFEVKGGHNLGIIHIKHKDYNRKYQHQCQSATNQTKELG